ncbi:MAG: efflux RND transporter permease subunit [Spirochaetaceae bacterium]
MSIPRFAVKHPVTSSMIFAALTLLGAISLSRVGLELFPDVSLPSVIIVTPSPGVGPFDVEEQISRRLENSVAGLSGVEGQSSTSEEGLSMVIVNFSEDTNLDTVVPDVRERINDVTGDFPDGTMPSTIFQFSAGLVPSLQLVVLSSTEDLDIRRLIENDIVPEIERVPGVSQVDLFGGRDPAVMVRVDLDEIRMRGIPLGGIVNAFSGDNVSLPAGTVGLEDRELVLRTVGDFESVADVSDVLVTMIEGVPVRLGDIAEIELDFKPQREFVRTRDGEGIRVAVQKRPGFNTVDVNEEVLRRLEELERTLPPSIRIEIQEDQANTVRDAIGGVTEAAWQGGLLAVLVLLFFLRNMRSTFIVTTVIPVSVVATFALIDFADMTLNLTSLAGITLAIGMFVDNAIVVLESIYRKSLSGIDPEEAAIVGTEEVGNAITASTLTSVSVFLPMLFVDGIAGIMFRDLSLTISFSLLVSLLSALILIPVMSSRLLAKTTLKTRVDHDSDSYHELSLADIEVVTRYAWLNRILDRIQRSLESLDSVYERGISWSLDHTKTILGGAVVILVMSVGSILLLGMEFLPEADEGRFRVDFETFAGATYAQTTEKAAQVEEIIREEVDDEYILSLASRVGDGGSNLGTVFVTLVDLDFRTVSLWDVVNRVEERVAREVLDVDSRISIEGMSSLAASSSGVTSPIVARISGDDLSTMNEYGRRIAETMRSVSGTRSVYSSYSEARPELQFRVLRREATSLGLSPAEIAQALRIAYNGVSVGTLTRQSDDFDIDVLLQDADRLDRERFTSMFFVNPAGTVIPLESVVEIREGLGPLAIERIDRQRVIEIRGSLTGERALNRVMNDVQEQVAGLGEAPAGTELEFTGSSAEMTDSFESLFLALLLAVGLVYMVMASQFENLVNPLLVMFSVPFAIIGLVAILLVTNTTFSILTFVGSILLVGIVVNNAIVLIDYIVQLQNRGVPLRTAIIEGGKTRLKPILMTTFTTLVGLLPMALGTGTGSEIMTPLGRSVVGGLTTSTLITVILIPTLYWVVETKIRKRDATSSYGGIHPVSFGPGDDGYIKRNGATGEHGEGDGSDLVHAPAETHHEDRHEE